MDLHGSSVWKSAAPSRLGVPNTPEEALELYLYYVQETGHNSTFPEDYGLDFGLMDVSMIDPQKIEEAGFKAPAYVGLDLETALDRIMWDAKTFKYAVGVRSWLKNPSRKTFMAEVEKLMDRELKKLGVNLDEPIRSLSIKAGNIARHRAISLASLNGCATTKKPNFIKRGKEQEFEVHLEYLIGGDGGCPRKTLLYFSYNNSFTYFLKTVQDATQLCTIPPIDGTKRCLSDPSRPSPFYDGSPRDSGKSSHPSRNKRISEFNIKNKDDTALKAFGLGPATSQPKSRIYRRSVRGYTLSDGPWIYRAFCTESIPGTSPSPFPSKCLELRDEKDYINIVEALQEANKRDVGVKHSIMIMHSREYCVRSRWMELQSVEMEANQHTKEMLIHDVKKRTEAEAVENERGMKRILDELSIKEFGDDEFDEGWMEMWDEKNARSSALLS